MKMAHKRAHEVKQEKLNKKPEKGFWEIMERSQVYYCKDDKVVKTGSGGSAASNSNKKSIPVIIRDVQSLEKIKPLKRDDKELYKGYTTVLNEETDITEFDEK